MALPSGIYTITNVRYDNLAHLPSDNDQEYVIGAIASDSTHDMVGEAEQWTLVHAGKDRYSMQNVKFGNYIRTINAPKPEDEVYTTPDKAWWRMRMLSDGKYMICPLENADLSWCLPDERHGTPIHLQRTSADPRCLWKILPLRSKVPEPPTAEQLGPFFGVLNLTGLIDKDDSSMIGCGGFGEVYRGKWKTLPPGSKPLPEVVVKVIRPVDVQNERSKQKRLKQLEREIKVWHALRHKNIVPFLGFFLSGAFPSMVSLWMENGAASPRSRNESLYLTLGNVKTYLEDYPNTPTIPLLLGIAEGLEYLHYSDPCVIHGDLKAVNVLINERGDPCLCDFGLSRMMEDKTLWDSTTTATAKGTTRWMAPELLKGALTPTGVATVATIESDVYAYGMTCLEILTRRVPFFNYAVEYAVMFAVLERQEAPLIPSDIKISPQLTTLWRSCWSPEPNRRPSSRTVTATMRRIQESLSYASFYWFDAHNAIDTSKRYYIKNRATGRFWSFIDTHGPDGYVVCGRKLHRQSYFHWILIRNDKDHSMMIETPHYGLGIRVTEQLDAKRRGLGSFRFIPVSGDNDWYFIGAGMESDPPMVVTDTNEEYSDHRHGKTAPIAVDDQCQMWQLIDVNLLDA